jgi:hypothetical protein
LTNIQKWDIVVLLVTMMSKVLVKN